MSWRPSFSPWLIALSVMIPTFMEVLDTAVANVSLPHIAGSLAATRSEATWVLTSYLIANAVVLPSTGWLARAFGRRNVLVSCLGLFVAASFWCGSASTLEWLVVARVLQGLGGGALQPLSQAILLESFPPAQLGAAMAIFGVGVVSAPIIGPTLGGWITDHWTWRWVFYINLPIGLLAMLSNWVLVEDPPYLRERGTLRHFDYLGFGLMAIGLGTLQVMLDRGQESDWFAASWICWLAVVAAVTLAAFVARELLARHPVVNLRVFRDRNFAIGTLMIFAVGAILYANGALVPLMLQNLMGYPALQSGIAVSPRGLGSLITILLAAPLVGKTDHRPILVGGFSLLAYSCWLMGRVNLQADMVAVAWPCFLNGMALGLIFVPMTASAVGRLRPQEMGDATGLFNLVRNIGGSVGVSTAVTYLARNTQAQQTILASHVTPFNVVVQQYWALWMQMLPKLSDLTHGTLDLMYANLALHASMNAFLNDFRILGVVALACAPLALFFHRVYTALPTHAHR